MPPWVFDSDRALTSKFSGNGKFLDSLRTVILAQEQRGRVPVDVLYRLLQRSIRNRDSQTGQDVVCLIRNSGLQSDSFLGSHVIRMLALFGKLQEANLTFSRLFEPTIYAWSAIIFANAVLGHHQRAFILYQNMNQRGFRPDGHTFVAILKACVTEYDLNLGMSIHADIVECGLSSLDHVESSIIDMYIRCGSLCDAHVMFDKIAVPNVVLWSIMMQGYTQHEQFENVLNLFVDMQFKGVDPNPVTYVCVLKACSWAKLLPNGMRVHHLFIFEGPQMNTFVGSCLIDMYVRCGHLHDARNVFDILYKQDATVWNAMISGYTHYSQTHSALELYVQMLQEGVELNQITLSCVFKACADARTLNEGKYIHSLYTCNDFERDLFVSNNLLNLYARCGDLENARKAFNRIHKRNVVTWTALIGCYAEHGQQHMAFRCFENMRKEEQDIGSWNSLISGYVRHGQLEVALWLSYRMQQEKMRPDSVTWSAAISGCIQYGYGLEALNLFQQMIRQGTEPDVEAFLCALKACSIITSLDLGKLVYGMIIERSFEYVTDIREALLIMYVACGDVSETKQSLNRAEVQSTRARNAMFARHERIEDENRTSEFVAVIDEAINVESKVDLLNEIPELNFSQCNNDVIRLYCKMTRESVETDRNTFIYVLRACSQIVTLSHGKLIYADVIECDLGDDILICNLTIDFFLKCASFKDAYAVFKNLRKRNVVTYNTILAACAKFGNVQLAEYCFHEMEEESVLPDDVTFLCILSAFSHFGKTKEVIYYFNLMRDGYGVMPAFVHHTCVADHLARMGFLKEGEDILQTMPFQPNVVGRTSLVSHCRAHGCLDIARQCIY